MDILEQSCKPPKYRNFKRIMILCDRDGFANMKEFLLKTLEDCVCYVDESSDVRMEDLFVFTEHGDYFISCEDSVFYNITNVILCRQTSSSPLNNIPSLFYDIFTRPEYSAFAEKVSSICSVDYNVLEGSLDNNVYEVFDDIDWYDVSETTLRQHMFVGAEIIANGMVTKKIKRQFEHSLLCYDHDLKDAFVKPALLEPGMQEYDLWLQLMTNIIKTKNELISTNMSYDIIRACSPGCSAKQLIIVATLEQWYEFFQFVDKSRMITSSDERQLVRIMADYFMDYAYIESFKTLLKSLISTIDTYEELPF